MDVSSPMEHNSTTVKSNAEILIPDIWLDVAEYLLPKEIALLKSTCKTLLQIFSDRAFWVAQVRKTLCQRPLPTQDSVRRPLSSYSTSELQPLAHRANLLSENSLKDKPSAKLVSQFHGSAYPIESSIKFIINPWIRSTCVLLVWWSGMITCWDHTKGSTVNWYDSVEDDLEPYCMGVWTFDQSEAVIALRSGDADQLHASCYHFILAKMSPTGGVTFEAARVLRGMPNYVDSTVYEDFCIVAVPYGDATGAAGTDDSNPKYFGLMMINWRTGKQLTIESGITIDAQNDEAHFWKFARLVVTSEYLHVIGPGAYIHSYPLSTLLSTFASTSSPSISLPPSKSTPFVFPKCMTPKLLDLESIAAFVPTLSNTWSPTTNDVSNSRISIFMTIIQKGHIPLTLDEAENMDEDARESLHIKQFFLNPLDGTIDQSNVFEEEYSSMVGLAGDEMGFLNIPTAGSSSAGAMWVTEPNMDEGTVKGGSKFWLASFSPVAKPFIRELVLPEIQNSGLRRMRVQAIGYNDSYGSAVIAAGRDVYVYDLAGKA